MKKKYLFVIIPCIVILLLVCAVWGLNALLTNFIENSNVVCKNQKFSSAEDAIQAMEARERAENDTSLDYCPPYKLVHTFDYDQNTIVVYSYCYSFDGEVSDSYAIRILKHNEDGTLSFDSGFAKFILSEPDGDENYYYFTNINTSKGNKSISFLYLPKDSNMNVYVDGIKAEKQLVSIEDQEFYICYALSGRDTFLSNLSTPISDRHKVEIK